MMKLGGFAGREGVVVTCKSERGGERERERGSGGQSYDDV